MMLSEARHGAARQRRHHRTGLLTVFAQVIDGARTRGIPVLFAPMAYVRADYIDEQLHRRSGIHRIMFERQMFLAGSWGADFHPDLQPGDGEIVLTPHKGSDVFETDLPEHLERFGTTHVVIAGLLANLCCEGTGRHASEHGYDVTFLRDAIGAVNLASYEASIRLNYPMVGNAAAPGTVHVHLPRIVIGQMPWDDPPTPEETSTKIGPARDDVPVLYRSRQPTD